MTTETAVTAVSYKKGLDRLKHLAGRAVMHLVLIISSILVAFPFIWMVTRSLMTAEELKRSRFTLIPSTIQWSNYLEFWHAEPLFPRYFLNSAIMAFGVLILQLIVAMLAAYAFTFVNFPGRNVLFFVAISTLMIPVVITYIPSYIILSSMPMWLRVCWSILLGVAGMVTIWLILRFLDTIFSGLAGRERPWISVLWRMVLVVGVGAAWATYALPALRAAGADAPASAQLFTLAFAFIVYDLGITIAEQFPPSTWQGVGKTLWRWAWLLGILAYIAYRVPHWLGENWLDTYQGLIIPSAVSSFGIFLFRQGFMGLPRELMDAAKIDGADHLRILTQIVMPLSKPLLVTFVIFDLVQYYSSYFWPLLITNNPTMRVLTIGLQIFFIEKGYYGIRWHLIMAANTAAVAPLLILFFLGQRWFVEGVATTGLKG